MKLLKNYKKYSQLKQGFLAFGFKTRLSFYNVCKSLNTTINPLELIEFWDLGKSNSALERELEKVLNTLRYE